MSGGQKAQPQTIQSQISCLCYSQKWNLYFACSKNFRLIVFNEHLNVVYWQYMPCRLITNLIFYEKGGQLIASGKEGCFLIDMDIIFSYSALMAILLDPKGQSIKVRIKQPKKKEQDFSVPRLDQDTGEAGASFKMGRDKDGKEDKDDGDRHGRDGLDDDQGGADGNEQVNDSLPVNFLPKEYGPHIKQLQGLSQWVNGLKVFVNDNLIVAWRKENASDAEETHASRVSRIRPSKDQIMFYALDDQPPYQQGEVWARCYDPTIKDDFITDLLIFKEHKFFITAHNIGDIHLRELVELRNIENSSQDLNQADSGPTPSKSVHVFKGHSQTVTSLAPIQSRPTHFVSASTDGKVRIWDFDRLIELYCFDIQLDSPVQNSAMADTIENVKLINERVYAMIFKNKIEIGLISHLVSSNFITK